MTKEEFLEKMTEIMDYEGELTMAAELADIEEWDSLSIVGFIAMANATCGKRIDGKKVKQAETVGDLFSLLED